MSGQIIPLAVTETCLFDDVQDLYNIGGYTFVSKCSSDGDDGGIGIVLQSELSYIVRNDITIINDCIECLFNKIV